MGRYSTDPNKGSIPTNSNQVAALPSSNPYNQSSSNMGSPQQMQGPPVDWPSVFPKPVVGLDLNGVIIEDKLLSSINNVVPIQGSLEAIRMLRLKGHKLGILSDQPDIMKGNMTTQNMDSVIEHLMTIFGNNGIFTIDGVLYNTSNMTQDEYAKPNTGMVNRMQRETGGAVNYKEGWYVGDSIDDLKMAAKAGAKPILVLTGNGSNTLKELDRHSNKDLKKKTQVFENLLAFASSL